MSHGRPTRRPRHLSQVNTLATAVLTASKFTEAEVQHIMQPVQDAFKAFREGVATEWHWKQLCSAVAIALSIEHKGVVKGLQGHLVLTDKTLETIAKRATQHGTWHTTPLWFQELDTLDNFMHLHEFQVRQLSAGEFRAAFRHAIAEIQRVGGALIEDARGAMAAERLAA